MRIAPGSGQVAPENPVHRAPEATGKDGDRESRNAKLREWDIRSRNRG